MAIRVRGFALRTVSGVSSGPVKDLGLLGDAAKAVRDLVHDDCAAGLRCCERCLALGEAVAALERMRDDLLGLAEVPGLLEVLGRQARSWWDAPQATWNWASARQMLPVVGEEEVLRVARQAASRLRGMSGS